ncbi:MAG: hypothetical protein LBQ94_07230 [Treponema sp.]|nr:hypothetical protein [Treponema sp.]
MIFIAAYTLFSFAAIFFLVRGVGAIAGLFLDPNGTVVAALSQLVNARVSVPVWIPPCGAAAVCALRAMPIKRIGGKSAMIIAASIVILLFAFAAAFLLTKVNGVFVHVAIGIIKMLLGSGML